MLRIKQRYGYARNDVDQPHNASERPAGNTTLEEARAQAEAIVSSSPLRADKWDRLDKRGPKNVRQMIEDTFVRGEMEKLDSGIEGRTLSQDEWVKAHQELRDRLLRRQPGDVDDEINAPGGQGGTQPGQGGGRPFPVPGMNPSQVPRSGGSTNSREHMGPRGADHMPAGISRSRSASLSSLSATAPVIAKGSGQGYGEYVDVRYEDGTIHRLAHLGDESKGGRQKAFADGIQVGSKVARDRSLATAGSPETQGRDFTHVHYEIFPDKSAYDKAASGSSRATAGLRINPRDYFSRGGGRMWLRLVLGGALIRRFRPHRSGAVCKPDDRKGRSLVERSGAGWGNSSVSPRVRFSGPGRSRCFSQQVSGHRVAEVNRDGSLKRFDDSIGRKQSYGPGQFKPGEYGLKTWADVNNPKR